MMVRFYRMVLIVFTMFLYAGCESGSKVAVFKASRCAKCVFEIKESLQKGYGVVVLLEKDDSSSCSDFIAENYFESSRLICIDDITKLDNGKLALP